MNKFKWIKKIIIYLTILILYVTLLTMSARIPNKYIKNNIIKSSEELLIKNEKTFFKFFDKDIILFNFTDALMLNTIYSTDKEKPLETSLLARRNYIKGSDQRIYQDTNPPEEQSEKAANYSANTYQTKELSETVKGRTTYDCIEYARYWHGYMIILKPLLLLFDYSQIQVTSIICFAILSIIFLYCVIKKIGIIEGISFFIAFVMVDLFICSASLNAIIPFYISIIAGIFLLTKYDKIKSYSFAFLIIGSITSFFDFLTTPLVTLGIPLIIKVLLDSKKDRNVVLDVVKMSIYWGIGYVTTMIAKWIITDILLNREVFITSLKQFLYRVGNESEGIQYTFLRTIKANLYYLDNKINITILILLLVIAMIYYILKNKKFDKKLISISIISILPFLWFGVLKNHSTIHSFFTYRNFVITIICFLILILSMLRERKNNK